jgi:hypothetical protein
MAKRHDIEADMEPVDAQRLRRFRALTEPGRGTIGAGNDRELDLQLSALEARVQEMGARIRALGARERGMYAKISALHSRISALGDDSDREIGDRFTASVRDVTDPVDAGGGQAAGSEVSLRGAVAELKFALRQLEIDDTLPPRRSVSLRRAVEREYRLTKAELDHRGDSTTSVFDDRYAPGPVAAILLDRQIPGLARDELAGRVAQLLVATNPQTARRAPYAAAAAVALLCVVGLYLSRGATPGFMIATISILSMLYVAFPGRRTPYPRLDVSDATILAYIRHPASSGGKGPRLTALSADATTHSQQFVAAAFNNRSGEADLAPHTSRAARPGLRKPARSIPQTSQADRERRITEVHAAVAELDTEWLEYRLDIHAWFLSKPQLRNDSDPVIAAYRQAHAELRDLAEDLTSLSTDTQIATAQQAARRALTAWGDANTYALEVGVSDLSPSEEAALKQLNGLVNTLNDRSTPKHQWAQLKDAIIRNMDKLIVTSFELNVIADLPVIAEESRLQALPAARGDEQQ